MKYILVLFSVLVFQNVTAQQDFPVIRANSKNVKIKDGLNFKSDYWVIFPETKPDHTFMEATDNLWITNTHIPDGDWLYQFDIGVLPQYRGLKLSTELYRAQQDLVRAWKMKGQVTVGMTSGYAMYQDQYSIQEYCERLKNKQFTDPTVTPQRKAGFQWITPIYNYVDDPTAGNCSVLMAWPLEGVSLREYIKPEKDW